MYVCYVVEQPIGTTTRLYKAFTTVGVGGGNSANFGRRHHRTMHAGLCLWFFWQCYDVIEGARCHLYGF